MKSFQKIVTILFLLVVIFTTSTSQVSADENFDKTLNSTYVVNNLGVAKVKHQITITNKNPMYYIQRYALKISSINLSNINITIDDQQLDPNITKTDRDTSIALTFPDKIVGQGKTRKLIIEYDNPDATVVTGNTLAVYVPKLADKEDYQEYSLNIYSPAKYGYPTRTYPVDHFSHQIGDQIKTEFDQIHGEGISALFGSSQIFDITLRYNLENDTTNTGLMQIALPPDSTYQKMNYLNIDPPPEEIKTDTDGNWIATYQVDAQSNLIVNMIAKAKITLEPNLEFPNNLPIKAHLEEQEFWQVNDSQIKQLANQLQTPKQIYDYVTNFLSYNQLADLGGKRLGAKQALAEPDMAVCQEFTDTFIAIARAGGIPARRITGYAYSENSALRPLSLVEDILHTWPEFYNSKDGKWQPVDPTWENTTGGIDYYNQFDLNHIVFAINGVDSSKPFSAGSYKLADQNTKDVEVRFSQDFPQVNPDFQVNIAPRKFLGLSIPGNYLLQITNKTGQAYYDLPVQALVDTTSKIYFDQRQLETILPLQNKQVPLYLSSNSIIPSSKTISIYIYDQQTNFDLTSGPNIGFIFQYSPILIGMGFSAVIITLITGSILVFRRKK